MSGFLINVVRKKGFSIFYSSFRKTPVITRSIVVLQQNLLFNESSGSGRSSKKDLIKITLIGPNNAITVVSLEEAQRLSKRRKLELVKVQDLDTKTQRPVYRLYTSAELLAEETAENSEDATKSTNKKTATVKNLTLSSRITDHDLGSRIKNIGKWLTKGYEVRILVQGASDNDPNCESIYHKIETAVKEANIGRIVQKRSKGSNVKFGILSTEIKKKES